MGCREQTIGTDYISGHRFLSLEEWLKNVPGPRRHIVVVSLLCRRQDHTRYLTSPRAPTSPPLRALGPKPHSLYIEIMPLTTSTVFSTALDCQTTAPTTYYSCHSLVSSAKPEPEHGAELAVNYWSEVTPTLQDFTEPVSLSTRKLEWSLIYRSQGYRLEEYLDICEANNLEKTVISQQHYDASRAHWGNEEAVWREYYHGYSRRPAEGWIGRESPVYGVTSGGAVNDDGSRYYFSCVLLLISLIQPDVVR